MCRSLTLRLNCCYCWRCGILVCFFSSEYKTLHTTFCTYIPAETWQQQSPLPTQQTVYRTVTTTPGWFFHPFLWRSEIYGNETSHWWPSNSENRERSEMGEMTIWVTHHNDLGENDGDNWLYRSIDYGADGPYQNIWPLRNVDTHHIKEWHRRNIFILQERKGKEKATVRVHMLDLRVGWSCSNVEH